MRILSFLSVCFLLVLAACFEDDLPDDRLNKEVRMIDDFLSENVTDYIAYDQSGIRIVIHEFGQLPPARLGQQVQASIVGKLFSNGTVFTTKAFTSLLDSIGGDGLKFCVSALMAGSRATVYIPSKYAFGGSASGSVPPNSILVYEINVLKTKRNSVEQARFELDTASIAAYLRDNDVENVLTHPSGVRYVVTTTGTGSKYKVYDFATIVYKGKLMSNNLEFDAGTLSNTSIFGLIDGFKVIIPAINRGSSVTMYIPSLLGYGPAGAGTNIPANANLIFEIELK